MTGHKKNSWKMQKLKDCEANCTAGCKKRFEVVFPDRAFSVVLSAAMR